MTREEQIINASLLYASYQQKPFLDGAKWADKHPREGLVDIEKVCEWLDGFLDETPLIEYQVPEDEKKRIIKSFVKAME